MDRATSLDNEIARSRFVLSTLHPAFLVMPFLIWVVGSQLKGTFFRECGSTRFRDGIERKERLHSARHR